MVYIVVNSTVDSKVLKEYSECSCGFAATLRWGGRVGSYTNVQGTQHSEFCITEL